MCKFVLDAASEFNIHANSPCKIILSSINDIITLAQGHFACVIITFSHDDSQLMRRSKHINLDSGNALRCKQVLICPVHKV